VRADTERTVSARVPAETVDWDAVYAACAPGLLAYLRRLSRDTETAEDLMQTTFQRAIAAKHTPPGHQIRPWLYRIASNLAIDQARRAKLMRFIPFAATEAASHRVDDASDAVRLALRAIAPELAVTLVLRLHEGFSRAEVASLTGVSERTVKWRLERGRAAFAAAYRRDAE
jgi:RNA polymerase sigma-70 factor (ECF subfamily)